jgi:hypothetical protein
MDHNSLELLIGHDAIWNNLDEVGVEGELAEGAILTVGSVQTSHQDIRVSGDDNCLNIESQKARKGLSTKNSVLLGKVCVKANPDSTSRAYPSRWRISSCCICHGMLCPCAVREKTYKNEY